MRKFSDSHVKNPEVLHLSSAGLQSLSPRHHNPKGLCSPSLLYMQSSDYCTGYKLCYFLHLTKKTAHSWKGDLSGPQLHSLREKIAHLTLPGTNWFQLRDDGQSRPYLFGHVWGQELIEFWYQSLSLFCTWLCMQSILMSACVVYLPSRGASLLHGAVLPAAAHACHCSVALISPSQSSLLSAASHHRLARLCDTEPNSELVSPSEANTLRNDPKFGCVVIMSGMTTIWVHMAVLVWSAICYRCKQAVLLIWIILVSQSRPCVAEFHHAVFF